MATPYATLRQLIEHLNGNPLLSPAGLHGLWCGRLSAGEPADSQPGWIYTLKVLGSPAEYADSSITEAFQRMRQFAMGSLGQDDFSFELWLPSSEEPCSRRLAALADWCRGYLEGLISVDGSDLEQLSDESRELVNDLMQIGEVDTHLDESEQDEREFLELAEFVKVAVLNIHLDVLQAKRESKNPPTSRGHTLH